jgi:signal peptide peptidase SppA
VSGPRSLLRRLLGRRAHASTATLDTPLLLAPGETLERIRAIVSSGGSIDAVRGALPVVVAARGRVPTFDGVAVLRVSGTLYRGMWFDDYSDLCEAVDIALDDPAVRAIVLDIDSPGGRVAGCFEAARHIAQSRGRKPIVAVANDQATSAAYALAAACDRVVASPTSVLGSIGVIVLHVDVSTAYEREGYTMTEITSGQHKGDASPYKPLSTEARGRLQAIVDQTAEVFFETVASTRPQLKVAALRALEAEVYTAREAVDIGLADEVAGLEEVVASLSGGSASQIPTMPGPAATSSRQAQLAAFRAEARAKARAEVRAEIEAEEDDLGESFDESVSRKAKEVSARYADALQRAQAAGLPLGVALERVHEAFIRDDPAELERCVLELEHLGSLHRASDARRAAENPPPTPKAHADARESEELATAMDRMDVAAWAEALAKTNRLN